MNENTVTRDDILLFLASQPLDSFRAGTFHLAIAQEFVDSSTPVVMDEKAMSAAIGVDTRQVRRLKAAALADDYWTVARNQRRASTYTPSPKLIDAIASFREKK